MAADSSLAVNVSSSVDSLNAVYLFKINEQTDYGDFVVDNHHFAVNVNDFGHGFVSELTMLTKATE